MSRNTIPTLWWVGAGVYAPTWYTGVDWIWERVGRSPVVGVRLDNLEMAQRLTPDVVDLVDLSKEQ